MCYDEDAPCASTPLTMSYSAAQPLQGSTVTADRLRVVLPLRRRKAKVEVCRTRVTPQPCPHANPCSAQALPLRSFCRCAGFAAAQVLPLHSIYRCAEFTAAQPLQPSQPAQQQSCLCCCYCCRAFTNAQHLACCSAPPAAQPSHFAWCMTGTPHAFKACSRCQAHWPTAKSNLTAAQEAQSQS